MTSLVIVAASIFEISCGKTDTQTNGGKKLPPRQPLPWVTTYYTEKNKQQKHF